MNSNAGPHLEHEVGNDAMEFAALVVQRLPVHLADSFFTGAQCAKIFGSLRNLSCPAKSAVSAVAAHVVCQQLTVSPKRPMVMRPIGLPSISMSKNTYQQ